MTSYKRGRDTREELLEERVQDEEEIYVERLRVTETTVEKTSRIVRMEDLTVDQRRLVSALIDSGGGI